MLSTMLKMATVMHVKYRNKQMQYLCEILSER